MERPKYMNKQPELGCPFGMPVSDLNWLIYGSGRHATQSWENKKFAVLLVRRLSMAQTKWMIPASQTAWAIEIVVSLNVAVTCCHHLFAALLSNMIAARALPLSMCINSTTSTCSQKQKVWQPLWTAFNTLCLVLEPLGERLNTLEPLLERRLHAALHSPSSKQHATSNEINFFCELASAMAEWYSRRISWQPDSCF